jgi:hypothetical protein
MTDANYGPKMAALPNDRWRAACLYYCTNPRGSGNDKGYLAATRVAGFEGTDATLRVTAHRIFHDQRMLDAIQEEVRNHIGADVALAREKLRQIAGNDQHPMQFAAVKTIVDKVVPTRQETQVNHEVTISDDTMARALQIAKAQGIDVQQLLGWRQSQNVIDVTPVEVKVEKMPWE